MNKTKADDDEGKKGRSGKILGICTPLVYIRVPMRVHNVQHAIPTGTSRAIVNSHSRRECIHLVAQEVVDRNISCNEEYPLRHFRSRVLFGDSYHPEHSSPSYEPFTST